MDIHFNSNARFTRWIVETKALHEPFVVVDVGVLGGENQRWHLLGDNLVVHGFDAVREQIEKLRRENEQFSNRHYHWIAAGNEDGERVFYVNPENPTSSSAYQQGNDRTALAGVSRVEVAEKVPFRKLDSLLADGTIPKADFLKVDVEGFEKDVFLGAGDLIRAGILGVEVETNFNSSPTYPNGHFIELHEILHQHRLAVFDLGFNRIARSAFQRALARKGLPAISDQTSVGKVSTLNVLFALDPIEDAEYPHHNPAPLRAPLGIDKLLKLLIVYELHGLSDVAVDAAEYFRGTLGSRIDVDRAIELLADPDCRVPANQGSLDTSAIAALRRQIDELEKSNSWRITAPLRKIRSLMGRLGLN